ncbi:MAG: CDP-alcohol phosphatidyltransferase family protein [Nitrososphaeraceae archaeon]|nr:CDP-alcohol phosphatidyltransferase family protein [Nitrososphaeraceae archaeon]MBV9666747.1 CDP-alcohol phosphatidyltransferase family protein [Nitrososphaeraceae archaeon]
MLNKFRGSLQPIMAKIGMTFASLGLSANFCTTVSLATSISAGAVYAMAATATPTTGFILPDIRFSWLYSSIIGSILLLISGFFDIIDGSIARATKQTSKKGAFLDSSFDKISEAVIFIGIAAGNLANPILCMIALSLSITVSYVRARAESLGVDLKGIGIGERAERLLIIAIIGMVPVVGAIHWAIIAISIVAGLTLIHRIATALKNL